MAWWLYRDEDVLNLILGHLEAEGALNVSSEESVADGMRTFTVEWMDRGSWKHRRVLKGGPLTNEVPERQGDRFIVPDSEVRTFTSPLGTKLTLACDGRTEFLIRPSGPTEVVEVHNNTLTGWSPRRRRRFTERQQLSTQELFQERLAKCRLATSQRQNSNDIHKEPEPPGY